MKAAIYGRSLESNRSDFVQQLFDKLVASDMEVFVYEPLYHFIRDAVHIKGHFIPFNRHEEIDGKADVLISLGGDGTLLDTIELVRTADIPIMGINTGRLGFLASIAKEEVNFAVDALKSGKYVIDKRTMLQLDSAADFFGEVNLALNEITLSRSDSGSMIVVHAYLNDEFLNSYFADGLIISTPTGSTAYNMSCGGPIVMPNSENFVLTPIAPHNLNVRPIIISDKSILKLKVEGRNPRFLATLDSRSMPIETGTELYVRRADSHINIVKLENHDFLTTLRSKLMWGLDKRT